MYTYIMTVVAGVVIGCFIGRTTAPAKHPFYGGHIFCDEGKNLHITGIYFDGLYRGVIFADSDVCWEHSKYDKD